jgi:hypothetical protein
MAYNFRLPLPRFIFHPLTTLSIAIVHVYLASVHLAALAAGRIAWEHIWKSSGALFGAYVFAALASRRFAKPLQRIIVKETLPMTSADRIDTV